MDNLKLYTIDVDYIKYLYTFDNHVMAWDGLNYKTERKYVGVVLHLSNFDYFAPLSSPKDKDYIYINGEKHIRKNVIPIVRLVTDNGRLLGKIVLANMIPVKESYITFYDVENEPDKKYRDLVRDEIDCIQKCSKEIMKNARILYNQKTAAYSKIAYLQSTLDFKLLETACLNYKLY